MIKITFSDGKRSAVVSERPVASNPFSIDTFDQTESGLVLSRQVTNNLKHAVTTALRFMGRPI